MTTFQHNCKKINLPNAVMSVFCLFEASLLKVFMFLGFHLLPPGHPLIPSASGDIMYLAYTREDDDEEDEDID